MRPLTGFVCVSALLHGSATWLAPRPTRELALAPCEVPLTVIYAEDEATADSPTAAGSSPPHPPSSSRAVAVRRRRARSAPSARAETETPVVAPLPLGEDGPPGPASAGADEPTNASAPGHGEGSGSEPGRWTAPVPSDANEPPPYPRIARLAGLEGEVVARLFVRTDGTVASAQILQGPELLQEGVLRAVQSWRYRPALQDGHPVAVSWLVRIPFRLR